MKYMLARDLARSSKEQNPVSDRAARIATGRSKRQLVQLQGRQSFAIVKNEVVNNGVVGFGL
jgi:hypothetical protein